jgi:hypothetical protein
LLQEVIARYYEEPELSTVIPSDNWAKQLLNGKVLSRERWRVVKAEPAIQALVISRLVAPQIQVGQVMNR